MLCSNFIKSSFVFTFNQPFPSMFFTSRNRKLVASSNESSIVFGSFGRKMFDVLAPHFQRFDDQELDLLGEGVKIVAEFVSLFDLTIFLAISYKNSNLLSKNRRWCLVFF